MAKPAPKGNDKFDKFAFQKGNTGIGGRSVNYSTKKTNVKRTGNSKRI